MQTKTRRPLSEQAQAAKAIRTKLKATWPGVTFKVTSESFAGGNAVDVRWTDGPTDRQVESLIHWHEEGTFDGMTDSYTYDRIHPNIPQAKYVQTQRSYSLTAKREAVDYMNQRYGWTLRLKEGSTYGEIDPASDSINEGAGGWKSQRMHQVIHPQPLVCHACHSAAHVGDDYCQECGNRLTDEHINR